MIYQILNIWRINIFQYRQMQLKINNLYNLVTKITKALKIVNIVIIALKVGLLAVAAIPPPTFPGAVSVLNSKLSKLFGINENEDYEYSTPVLVRFLKKILDPHFKKIDYEYY